MYRVVVKDRTNAVVCEDFPISARFFKKLNDVGFCNMDISAILINRNTGEAAVNPNVQQKLFDTWLRVFLFIEIKRPDGGVDTSLVWEGWIQNISTSENVVTLNCVDFLGFAERRLLRRKDYNNTDVTDIIRDSLNETNNDRDTGFQLISTLPTKLMDMEVEHGRSLASVIEEAIEFGGEVKVEFPNIFIGEFVGRDLTGTNGVTLYNDFQDSQGSNILAPQDVRLLGSDKANGVFWKSKSGEGRSTFVGNDELICLYKEYEDDSSATALEKANTYVDEYQTPTSEIVVVPKPEAFPIGSLQIGDLVRLFINNENPYLNTDMNMRIVEIGVDENSWYVSQIKLSDKAVKRFGERELRKQLRRVQLRT